MRTERKTYERISPIQGGEPVKSTVCPEKRGVSSYIGFTRESFLKIGRRYGLADSEIERQWLRQLARQGMT
jgi:hypothetical protein